MVGKTNNNKATADGPNSTQNQNPIETHFCNNIGIVVSDSCSWLVSFKEWDFRVNFLLLIQNLKGLNVSIPMFREASGDFRMKISNL